uniref:Carboxylic ester hydrolase n=1 Tax=Haemonchus contortus TaxID=6289 RepID=A0A7I4XYC3_HAECO
MWLPLATLLLTVLASTAAREVVVKTSRGSLVGYQSVSSSGKLVNIFKQIPYAEPPVDELRFQRPHEVRKWSGIRDATEYGPACMSNSSTTTSPQKWVDEDCLHLNIFAGADCLKNSCPVAFYIHGGGFNYDSAVMFKDEALVDNFGGNDVILVIPGVRLGFFGLLTFASDDVVPRNLAAYDLLAALQFVRKEIQHFGGDPGNVALMGHSGGAVAVAQLAFSKQIDPDVKLFQKGVIMSMAFGFSDESHMQNLTTELAYRAECIPSRTSVPSSNAFTKGVVHCLRQLDSFEILRIQREMEDEDENLKPEGFIMAKPLFEANDLQDFLHDPPPRAIMTGTTVHEFDNSLKVDVRPIMSLLGMNNTDEIVAKYRQDYNGRKLPSNHTTETQTIFVSTYVVGHSMRAAGGETYLYSYKNPRHAKHTDDLSYIMGVHMFEQDANEKVLAVIYPKLFTDFIKSGKPRKDWTPLHKNLDNYMHIDVNVDDGTLPHMALGYEKEVIGYWETMKTFDESLTKLKESVAETRDMDSPFRSYDRTPTIMLISIPIVVVVCAVLVIGYVVRQRQRRRSHPGKPDETTPLVSGNFEAGMPQPSNEWNDT